MKITDAEKKALKGRGYIMTRDGEHFVGRIITEDGVLTSEELMVAAEAAKKFGSGAVAMTSRMTVEVQGLTYETIGPFDQFLRERGLYTGGTGARVRPIVACKGTVCVHGLIDTQALARELHEKFYKGWYDVKLPHKFKIGIGGCPNNCVKPSLNDFGIMGQRMPEYDSKDCHGCGRCLASERCPVHAAHMENGVMEIDRTLCTSCGKCIDNCVFHTVSEKKAGYAVFVGGLWGKRQRMGNRLPEIYTKEEVFQLVEKAILLYREQGWTGERFGAFIDRIGPDNFIAQLTSDEVLARKQSILDSPLLQRGESR